MRGNGGVAGEVLRGTFRTGVNAGRKCGNNSRGPIKKKNNGIEIILGKISGVWDI